MGCITITETSTNRKRTVTQTDVMQVSGVHSDIQLSVLSVQDRPPLYQAYRHGIAGMITSLGTV